MSRIEQTKCDQCGDIVADPYSALGWLKVTGSFSISKGVRADDKSAKTRYASAADRDFCGTKCFQDWLKAIR